MNMTLKQAMDLIRKICGEFTGTLQDHDIIQHALGMVQNAAAAYQKPEPEKDKETE